MLTGMLKHWWILVLRGLISILFAVLAFTRPDLTFTALVVLLGAFILLDGIVALVMAVRTRGDHDWGVVLLEGLLGIALGVATLMKPEMTAALLILFVALWCLITGVFEISTAIRLRKEITNEWMLGLAGVVSIVLGAIMLFRPNAGAISITWWIGGYALFFGLLLVGLGFKLRAAHHGRLNA
ncbi:MAG: HdeD family acid-resistance protein [Saprospiraceae bacterium]